MRAHLRGVRHSNSSSVFPETPQTAPNRWCRRQSSTSTTHVPPAGSREKRRVSGNWRPRPCHQYEMGSQVGKVPRRMPQSLSLWHKADRLLTLFLTSREAANRISKLVVPPAFEATIKTSATSCCGHRSRHSLGSKVPFEEEVVMKRIVLCLLLLPLCLSLSPSAWATWGSFKSTGTGTGVGFPSCAQVSSNHVVCAVRSGKDAIMVNDFNGTAWGTTWTSLAGAVASDPSCTSAGAGKAICAATATNGNFQWSIFDGTTWSAPATVSAALYSAPSCAEYTSSEVLCVARNVSGGLAWSLYNGTTWKAFASLTTSATSTPNCTTDNNNGVICAVLTTGSATLVNRFAAGAWKGFLNIAGIAAYTPNCTSLDSAGNAACFVVGVTSIGVFGSRFNGGAWTAADWTTYSDIGGYVTANANCTTQSAGELVCGVIGAEDNAFYSNVYNGSSWSGWGKVGGLGINSPACAPLGTGQVVCVVLGINNKLTSVVGP